MLLHIPWNEVNYYYYIPLCRFANDFNNICACSISSFIQQCCRIVHRHVDKYLETEILQTILQENIKICALGPDDLIPSTDKIHLWSSKLLKVSSCYISDSKSMISSSTANLEMNSSLVVVLCLTICKHPAIHNTQCLNKNNYHFKTETKISGMVESLFYISSWMQADI